MNVRIGLAQVKAGNTKEESLNKAISVMAEASKKNVDLLVFPECYMVYLSDNEPKEVFSTIHESLDGPFISAISSEALKRKMHVAVGVYEKPLQGEKTYNTVVLIGPNGSILSANRKLHAFDSFGYRESDWMRAADGPGQVVETSFGKIGTMVCYDLRFPETARMMALRGAQIIIVPAAWLGGLMKEDHLITLVKARALENTVFMVECSQPGRIFSGRSMVVDPFGVVICDAGEAEHLVVCEIDLERINQVRAVLPCLDHLRKNIYADFWFEQTRGSDIDVVPKIKAATSR